MENTTSVRAWILNLKLTMILNRRLNLDLINPAQDFRAVKKGNCGDGDGDERHLERTGRWREGLTLNFPFF